MKEVFMNLISIDKYTKTNLIKLAYILKILSETNTKTFTYVSNGENPCLTRGAGYLILPKALLSELSVRLQSQEFSSEEAKIMLHILHPIEFSPVLPDVFMTLDEFDERSDYQLPNAFKALQPYSIFKTFPLTRLPKVFENSHPLHWASSMCLTQYSGTRSDRLNITLSEKELCAVNIFIDADDPMTKSLEIELMGIAQIEDDKWLENLTKDQADILKSFVDLVGYKKVKSLTCLMNPELTDYYSSEANLILEVQEAVLIDKEGNSKMGFIQRAAHLLHEKHPDITPKLHSDPKEYNAPTKRITTAANPDKNKK